jgi:hypothetical protein
MTYTEYCKQVEPAFHPRVDLTPKDCIYAVDQGIVRGKRRYEIHLNFREQVLVYYVVPEVSMCLRTPHNTYSVFWLGPDMLEWLKK